MELRHLRYVLAAAQHGTFLRAATVLEVHPSALSRRIRDIEDELGSALFIRESTGVLLTYAGEQFVRRARRALIQIIKGAE